MSNKSEGRKERKRLRKNSSWLLQVFSFTIPPSPPASSSSSPFNSPLRITPTTRSFSSTYSLPFSASLTLHFLLFSSSDKHLLLGWSLSSAHTHSSIPVKLFAFPPSLSLFSGFFTLLLGKSVGSTSMWHFGCGIWLGIRVSYLTPHFRFTNF